MKNSQPKDLGSPTQAAPQNLFFVVGIGASAGGIAAFKKLLQNLPANTGAAFVLLQHLDPKHKSVLPALLSSSAAMPIDEARDGMPVEPNRVYVTPAAMDLEIADGHLKLVPRPADRTSHLPIDGFFRRLAEVQGEKSVGVVLSGTASDGTLGLQAIHAAGGTCFAQDPQSAKFDGMPRSAIAAGCVDAILPPEEIAAAIARLAAGRPWSPLPGEVAGEAPPDSEEEALAETFRLLRRAMGNDFGVYKRATLLRRLRRRMGFLRIRTIHDYAQHLQGHPDEVQALHQDLLIGVTSFFRDPTAIEALCQNVLPKLLEGRPAEAPLRLWVPGCSTGEEVYTLAICLLELLSGNSSDPAIQIFGTDVSESALAKARAGIYPASIAGHVSPGRVERFFTPAGGNKLQIRKSVRALCVFARHDLIQDPPFSRLDLISCRNVLIYLKAAAQKTVMAGFHYALKPEGFLVLGAAEGLSASLDLFRLVEREHKIFAPKAGVARSILGFGAGVTPREEIRLRGEGRSGAEPASVQRLSPGQADPALLSPGPAGALADAKLEILQFRGKRFFLVPFEDLPTSATPQRRKTDAAAKPRRQSAADRRIAELEEELTATRRYLRSIVEDQGAASQDLQASHEEALSRNEELQSLNEEMETAKEELQSGNEELTTLNEELSQRNLDLVQLSDDLVNLLGSLHIPVVLLSLDLRLRRFTPGAAKLFNLLPTDRNRLLSDLRSSFDVPDLGKLILQSIESITAIEREVQDASGRWYSLRIRPFETSDHRIDGAVMILVDIDALKRSATELAKARDFADAIVQTVREPLLVLSGDLRVEEANRAFYDFFRIAPEEADGVRLEELGRGAWNLPELHQRLEKVLRESMDVDDFEVAREFPGIGFRTIVLSARRVRPQGPGPEKILLAMEDRTDVKRVEEARAALLAREQAVAREAERASRLKDEFVATVSHELRGPLSAMNGWMYVLDQSPGDAEITARGMASIRRNLQAQAKLVDDLLDTARVMTGKLHLSPRLMELLPVVEAAVQAVGSAAEAKGITVRLSSDGTATSILGDPDRTQQIAWNLLSNAVKFTPSGGRVDARLERVRKCVQLQVRDTGKGISPEFQPHVFDRFRQAETSPTRDQLGLGLGLAIVKDLTELQGGTVKVESLGKDQGATFTVSFPVPALLVEEAKPDAEVLPAVCLPMLAGLRLLVVEDEDSSREMLVALLEQHGAEVVATASAKEARAALEGEVPDVLISDIGMPGESGYDLLRKMRKLPPERGGQVPAIAFTAYSSEQDRLDALAAGFQMHHTKPTDPTRLIAAIAALGRRSPST